jgi:outer membrane protein assembly factor BamB
MEAMFQRSLAVAALVLLPITIRAEDWPQWRGPNRDGVWTESGILTSFPPGGLKIRWRVAVGPGWSSPVIAQGRVYLTDSQLMRPKAQERVLCFEEKTGKRLWDRAYDVSYPDWAFTPAQETGPSATPIIEGGKFYFLSPSGHVRCLDARTGEAIWERYLHLDYRIRELICRSSPLIDGNLLIVFTGARPDACVMALDKRTGGEVWKALDEPVSNSSPILVEAGSKKQLIVWTEESVTSLDPATGKVYWRERMNTSNNDAIATPIFQKNLLLVGGLMLKLDDHKPAATVLWPNSKAVQGRVLSNTSTAMFRGDYLYSAKSSGELVCLEARTGKEIWKTEKVTDLKNGASIHLTPNGDGVFLYTNKGELIRAQLTPQGHTETGRCKLLEPVYPFAGRKCAWSPPAFANGHVFARNEKELVCASLTSKQ